MRALSTLSCIVLMAACAAWLFGPPPGTGEEKLKGIPEGVVYRWRQRLDEHGRIPPGALMRAKAERDLLLRMLPPAPAGAGAVTGPGAPRDWVWLGPGNVGGRIRGLCIHPTVPSTMWVGSVSGGIWKTTDAGASWFPLNDFLASLTIGCMVMDPMNPDRLYAGTGEGFFDTVQGSSNTAAIQGAGVFLSTDGGATWNQLPSTAGPDWWFVNRIAFDPTNSLVMLAATGTGIYRSTDGGASWSRRTTTRTLDVDFHPTDPARAVAGRHDAIAQHSLDGGMTWTNATGITGRRVEVAYARTVATVTVYASVSGTDSRIRVYRSTDGGVSYTLQTSGSGISTYSLYNNALWVDPFDPNIVVTGGVDLYRSTNGGVNLTQISRWSSAPASAYADHHVIVEHPGYNGTTNRTAFFGNDGGIYRATDVRTVAITSGWTELNNNLGITQFYGAAMNPTSGILIGGTQDNGTQRYSGGTETWTRTFGGDGGFCAADPTDPNYFYGEIYHLRIFRSTNAGLSASYIYSGINDPTANFIPHFVLDPNNPNRMLAGGAQLWRSDNVKAPTPAWTSIKPALACFQAEAAPSHFADNPPCNISTITVAEGNPAIVWVGHNNGRLYKTTNGTAPSPTWVRVDENAPGLPDRWISRIAIDRTNHDRVTVSLLGYAPDSLWRSGDGGLSWTRITGTPPMALPTAPVSGVALHRALPGLLYAATDLGLYWSGDDGATWATSNDGPGPVAIDEVFWKNDRTLVAATHGRGVYTVETHDTASASPVGPGCGRTGPPSLGATPPVLGTTHTYTLAGASPSAPVTLIYGFGPATPTNLGGGCVAQVNLQAMVLIPAGSTNALGGWTFGLALPLEPSLVGLIVTAQDLIAVAGGPLFGAAELTNGVEMRLGL